MIDAMQDEKSPVGNGKELPVRYDGKLKVMGKAKYAAEFSKEMEEQFKGKGMVYAYLVLSHIASGEIVSMDTTAADRASGVVKILTPFNAPKLPMVAPQPPATRKLSLLQDRNVYYNGEPIGVVVAKSQVEAAHAASLIKVKYKASPPKLGFEKRLGEARMPKGGNAPKAQKHGNEAEAWAKATTVVEQTYSTPLQTHNPMEPHATIAAWDGEKLTVYDATQYISGDKLTLAKHFSLPLDNVHVIDPYVGGGFGSKGSTWSHVILCAVASKVVGAPVRLAMERTQMFGPVGGRPKTVQKIKLGTDANGKLVAMQHDVIMPASIMEDFLEAAATQTTMLYQCDQISTSHKMVDMNIGVQTFQRAPGESVGTTALESAMDELAIKLNMDPLQLRLLNYAEKDPGEQKEFSSKNLKQAYTDAAQRFGWTKRNGTPGAMREGNKRVGYGMATATYPANRSAAMAVVRLLPSGRIFIGCGTQDLGTGMYTMMAQTVVQELDVPWDMVDVKLGDSTLPKAPVSGGSQSTASVGPAVKDACSQLKLKLASMAVSDPSSKLYQAMPQDIDVKGGMLTSRTDPSKSEPLSLSITRNKGAVIEEMGSGEPSQEASKQLSTHSWGAVFVEVAVDEHTHMVEVRRVVATYDIGKLLNQKTGMSQLEGGIVWGIGTALTEETVLDNITGRIVNNNLAEYHVPVNLDAGTIDVSVIDRPDIKFNPQGARGIGEIGITGIAGAIANAIYNATGKRVRDFPITPDKIMAA
ncbi:xanthine dehydrogenase family protein molybdopterin-binding subunit [Terriglobus roseus]|uniref:Xanthine dehydrogenase, molybdenum binding subunit apoprotein n=1 Tax=Terriglobus roseus TaxID=392734 RepID=A0A1H4IV85_9BACT|nr:xanthine dehydrogenase family protein molybdopterin-binding subunit [Terriglobus roseus]SEB38010.1 xanthine dehydrogenase, molybdenum binding subunit apoprotein [Terriglobus roseus]